MTRITLALFTAAFCIACDDAEPLDPDPPAQLAVSGTVTALPGGEVAEQATLGVAWVVSAGSPDTVAVFGRGTVEGDGFTFELPTWPPPDVAINDYRPNLDLRLGVGVIVALPPGAELPADGLLDEAEADTIFDSVIGGADRYAIIFVEGDSPPEFWTSRFEPGVLQCGRGVPGVDFEAFEPIDCSEIELRFGMPLDWVNWT